MNNNIRIIAIAIIVIAVVGGILIAVNSGDDLEGTAGGNKDKTPPGQEQRETAQAQQPTQRPPTQVPPTQRPPTQVPPTQRPPTQVPPTQVPPTEVPPTQVPPTEAPPTDVPEPTEDSRRVTICHATSSETNPYVIITVSVNAAFKDQGGHFFENGNPQVGHEQDFVIGSAPADYPNVPTGSEEDCIVEEEPETPPTDTPEPESRRVTICHATSSETNPYVIITISVNAAFKDQGGHFFENGTTQAGHEQDFVIGSAPAGYPNVPTGSEEDCMLEEEPEIPEEPESRRVTICHATSSETNPYVIITISVNAAFKDQGGHFFENGTTQAGHEQDFVIGSAPADYPNVPTGSEEDCTLEEPEIPEEPEPRYTICHVAGRAEGPANYVILRNIPLQAFRGHFDENGTPEAGHEQDFTINNAQDAARCAPSVPETPETPECGELIYDESGFAVPYGGDCEEDEEPTPTPEPELPYIPPPQEPATCVDWIVYHTDFTGDWEIFRLGDLPAGQTGEPNLSKGVDSFDVAPSRSPDARAITFASNRDGNWEIYMATVDGLIVQRITRNALAIDIDPVWSPTGEFIAYESNRLGNWELYLVDVETGEESRLTASPANDINPYWSPDGSKLLFQSDDEGFWQIYELDLSTDEVTLLSDGEGDDHDPQYSFDGTEILFRSYRDGDNSVIYKMDADGSNVTRLSDLEGDASNHVWAPDDVAVAYESNLDGDLDIYVYEFESEETRKVTDNDIADYAPTWVCDSTTVVFTSDVTGNPDIFSTNALPIEDPAIVVEEEAAQLTDDISNDQYPQNSPAEENASRQGALPSPPKNK